MKVDLDKLSEKAVVNIFSYTLVKFDDAKQLVSKFEGTLRQLYELKNYNGGWDQQAIDKAVNTYVDKTDAIKRDYRDKKITSTVASSVTVIGGILSFTPLAPVGWGLIGIGSATNAIAEVVNLVDTHKQKAWETAKNNLKNFVENPFEGTTFAIVYTNLIEAFVDIQSKVAIDDYSILLQGLGWNYFAFRKEGMTHNKAIKELIGILDFFRTNRYTLSTDLKVGKQAAIQDMQNLIQPCSKTPLILAGSMALIGLAAGIGVGATIAGINIAASTIRYAETIAHGLLKIGSFACRSFNVLMTAGASFAIIGGLGSILMSIHNLTHIDETFKPYYAFKDECVKLINQYAKDYAKNNTIIVAMLKFMNEEKEVLSS